MKIVVEGTTQEISNFFYGLKYENLPEKVIKYTKLLVLDFLASATAGYRVNKTFNKAALEVYAGMGGKQESTVLFGTGRLPAPNAAFLNAVFGHGADLDDGNRTAMGHPGVATIPAVLALAEACGTKGRDVITAIVSGYDMYVRLSNVVMPSHFMRGFHGTGTVGAVAAGVASAKILGLSEEGIRRSLSLAAIQASGLFEVTESGQMAKPINPGNAVRTGVVSALLAMSGADAPKMPLEGNKGFLKAFSDQVDVDQLLQGLGQEYKITACYMKPYPACRHIHAPIDVALKLRERGIPSLDEIEDIKIYAYPAAIRVTGNIMEPVSIDEAKFSLTYATAVAFHSGHYTLDDLEAADRLSDEIRAWIHKMHIVSDPALENRNANVRGSRIDILLKNGGSLSESVALPKGDPEVPMDENDIRNKLKSCARGILEEKIQDKIYDCGMDLENIGNIRELLAYMKETIK